MSVDPDGVYSGALLASLVSGGLALLAGLAVGSGRGGTPERVVSPAAVTGWVLLLVSVAVHLRWGHTPGTPRALPPVAFLREHVSFAVAALLPAAALGVARAGRARGRQQPRGAGGRRVE